MDDTGKIHVLMVDDEDDFRQAAQRVLRRRGFDVSEARSGESALDIVRLSPPDVVLLDLRMEGMDGIETLEEMRRVSPDLPVIILTGHGGLDDAMAGIELDIVDFVQKPVDMDHLARRIWSLLRLGGGSPLREKTIGQLMVPADSYRTVTTDRTVAEAVDELRCSLALSILGREHEKGHRSVIVREPGGAFAGMLRIEDVLEVMIPAGLRDSPHASFFTGMFLAQSKLIGSMSVGELLDELQPQDVSIEEDAPLMEAVHLMLSTHVNNLPVMRGSEIVGVLRDKDLLLEIAGGA